MRNGMKEAKTITQSVSVLVGLSLSVSLSLTQLVLPRTPLLLGQPGTHLAPTIAGIIPEYNPRMPSFRAIVSNACRSPLNDSTFCCMRVLTTQMGLVTHEVSAPATNDDESTLRLDGCFLRDESKVKRVGGGGFNGNESAQSEREMACSRAVATEEETSRLLPRIESSEATGRFSARPSAVQLT